MGYLYRMFAREKTPAAGTVVVVTGASAGVGRAAAEAFAGHACKVALMARGRAGLDGAAESVRAAGGEPLALPVDVGDAEAVERAADQVERELVGQVRVGEQRHRDQFSRRSRTSRRRSTGVRPRSRIWARCTAHWPPCAACCPATAEPSSRSARPWPIEAIPLQAPYCGAKHAIQGFTESLRWPS